MHGNGRPGTWRATLRQGHAVLARLQRSRRGAVAVGFGVAVVGFLGLAGIATEAGYWYSAHRKGQNAADAAAIAAATVKDSGQTAAVAKVSGLAVAARNSFSSTLCATSGDTRVCINNPPVLGSYTGDNGAFEAIIDQVQSVTFSRLFGITAKTVSSRGVATIQTSGPACVLTLTDTLNITGNFTANATDCMFASNKKGSDSIDIGGSSIVNVQSLHASGQCSGCNSNNVTDGTPYTEYGRDTTNPFAALNSVTWPSFNGGACQSYPANGGTLTPYNATTNAKAYCSDMHLSNSTDGFYVTPGTYVFYNANITINNGFLTCVGCNASTGLGVSIVLLGNNGGIGDLTINATASVTLNAGTNTTQLDPNLAGLLFYRQDPGNDVGGPTEIQINGGASSNLQGGFYFPRADATYNGNSSSTCTVIVGGAITMNGDATFSTSGCSSMGTGTPKVRSVALVE